MIVDLRIHTCKPNRVNAFPALCRDHARPPQRKHLGRCLGWYVTVEGAPNQVVPPWACDSQADREAKRAALAADPARPGDLARVAEADVLVHVENRILRPAPHWTPPPGP
ncbi:MAG: NIPSNAP family protein [Acetobacteraceae bacterium]